MPADHASADITSDAALGGRLKLSQPRRGHRFGHDAILLAAATTAESGHHAVELGAGVGAAGLALACRVAGLRLTLVEIDPVLADLARQNAAANGFGDRVKTATLDATGSPSAWAEAGLPPGCADAVLMNPPFNDPARVRPSPDVARARAHIAPPGALAAWIATAARLLQPNGVLTLIWRADGLTRLLSLLDGFGGLALLPVHPRPDAPAIRILARAAKGSQAPLQLFPPLVLADAQGRPSAAANAVLRDAKPLPLATMG